METKVKREGKRKLKGGSVVRGTTSFYEGKVKEIFPRQWSHVLLVKANYKEGKQLGLEDGRCSATEDVILVYKSGGIHEKLAVPTWNLGNSPTFALGLRKTAKT
jgi:hypothetical protein